MNHVEDILKRSIEIHLKKRADYTTDPTANPFENFDRANQIALWFPDSYKSFAVLIATKLARLASLLVSGRKPSNESIEDSFLDLVTYCALFYGYWKSRQEPSQSNSKALGMLAYMVSLKDENQCQHIMGNPSGTCTYCGDPIHNLKDYQFDSVKQAYIKLVQ